MPLYFRTCNYEIPFPYTKCFFSLDPDYELVLQKKFSTPFQSCNTILAQGKSERTSRDVFHIYLYYPKLINLQLIYNGKDSRSEPKPAPFSRLLIARGIRNIYEFYTLCSCTTLNLPPGPFSVLCFLCLCPLNPL